MANVKYGKTLSKAIDEFLINIKLECYEKARLRSGLRVLDAGCGYGNDVLRMSEIVGSTGQVFGLEINRRTLSDLDAVQEPANIMILAGDVRRLPFAPNSFDLVWSDRVLQHVASPQNALREFYRVMRPGGKLLLADSDHCKVEISGSDLDLTRKLMRYRAEQIENPEAGSSLYKWAKAGGFIELDICSHRLNITSLKQAIDLGLFFENWQQRYERQGDMMAAEVQLFLADITKLDGQGSFAYSCDIYALTAKKPGE